MSALLTPCTHGGRITRRRRRPCFRASPRCTHTCATVVSRGRRRRWAAGDGARVEVQFESLDHLQGRRGSISSSPIPRTGAAPTSFWVIGRNGTDLSMWFLCCRASEKLLTSSTCAPPDVSARPRILTDRRSPLAPSWRKSCSSSSLRSAPCSRYSWNWRVVRLVTTAAVEGGVTAVAHQSVHLSAPVVCGEHKDGAAKVHVRPLAANPDRDGLLKAAGARRRRRVRCCQRLGKCRTPAAQ